MWDRYSFFDLYPYILLVLFFVLVYYSKLTEQKKERIIFVTILCFTILRYNVGWDYETYVEEIGEGAEYIISSRYEPLPRIIFYLSALWNFYPLAFVACGTIHLCLLRKVIRKLSPNMPLSWLFYFLIPLFFLQDLSTIRQAAATQFLFCSYLYIREGNYKKFLLFIALGSLFHISCLYGLCLLFFARKKISNVLNWALFIFSYVASELIQKVLAQILLSGRLGIYFGELFEFHETSLLNYYYYAINVLILLNYRKLVDLCEDNAWFIQIANWGVVTFNIFIFEPITSTRLSVFFLIFWILILPSLSQANKFLANKLVLLSPFIIVFFFFLWLYVMAYNTGSADKVSFIPYKFWLNNLRVGI